MYRSPEIGMDTMDLGPKKRFGFVGGILAAHAVLVSAVFVYWITSWIHPFKWFGWDGIGMQALIVLGAWGAPLLLFAGGFRWAAPVLVAATALAPWGFFYIGIAWSLALSVLSVAAVKTSKRPQEADG